MALQSTGKRDLGNPFLEFGSILDGTRAANPHIALVRCLLVPEGTQITSCPHH
jgi:hypothetical protein